jgi:class 3 adenylate cyclase
MLYRRLGRHYLPLALSVMFPMSILVVLGGVAMLYLYVEDFSAGDFGLILAVAEGFTVLETSLALAGAMQRLRPAKAWLRGDRSPEAVAEAWRALAGLPLHLLRKPYAVLAVVGIVSTALFATFVLDEPVWLALPALTAGATVVVAYEVFLRFFATELIVRPVLADVARAVPDGTALNEPALSLRWRLLIALPTANIITGVVVAGLAGPDQGIGALGFGVLFAIGVAFTISLELTLLLSRSILAPLNDLRAGTARVAEGDFSARVPVMATDETGSLAGSFNRMVAGLEERERLREAFGTFVDPDVADRVLRQGTILEGEEVEVTVLFLDIRGFTAYAERASAHDVVAHLNDFYEHVVPVLLRQGGHANKFVGDGLLAVFGAPERWPDHADRAVAAALEIARVVDDVYGGDLRIGIGVNSGPVLAGTIGGGGRLEFTVIGDAVNTASRVEQATRETGDTILVTDATLRLLRRDHGGFEERPATELRGKSEPVALFAPGATALADRRPATQGPLESEPTADRVSP